MPANPASGTTHDPLLVGLGDRSYPIRIGGGLLGEAGALIKTALPAATRAFVVTDATVAPRYLAPLQASLKKAGVAAEAVTIPAGEASKSFAQYETLCEALLALRPDRATPVIALGGGVVGDLAGFTAGTLLRGVPFVQIPTTLLAQVDSSVGGKTGINTKAGKNLVGCFTQPRLVIADTGLLATLPARELRAGYAEIVKTALLADAAFFAWLETHGGDVLSGHPDALARAIRTCCAIKAAIVGEDEREQGRRALLNLGHTFGHALEAWFGYDGRLLHGEAVALGLVQAALLSEQQSHLTREATLRIAACLRAAHLPASMNDLPELPDESALLRAMYGDKKQEGGRLTFILMEAIGKAFIARDVPERAVLHALQHSHGTLT